MLLTIDMEPEPGPSLALSLLTCALGSCGE